MNDETPNQNNTPMKDNSIYLDKQKNLNNNSLFNNIVSPISNKTQQATSLAFSQIMSSESKNQSILLDKDKLFESFLLFQKFMDMNQLIPTVQNPSPKNKNNEVEKRKEIDFSHTQEHIDTEGAQGENKEGTKNIKNYDDIPIKPKHSDFMELVEKTLANDSSAINPTENSRPVKKIVKPTYYKKEIKISKPSKNEKKYTYYTDVLDENGQFNEKKVLKTLQKSVTEQKTNSQQEQIESNNKEDINKTEEKKEEEKTKNIESNTLTMKEQKIDEQIKELNKEIVKFKEERTKVFDLKNEYEKLHQHFLDELEQFNIQKRDFEIEREIEEKKYEKEKKSMLQEMKGFNSIKIQNQNMILTAKKDKEQIQKLKNEINKIQKESKKKEVTNQLLIEKLKKQIEELKRSPPNERKEQNKNKGRSTSQYQNISKSKTSLQFSQKNLSTKEVNNIKTYTKSRTSLNPISTKTKKKTQYNSSRKNQPKEIKEEVQISHYNRREINNNEDVHTMMIKELIHKSKLKDDNFDFIIPEEYSNENYTLLKSATTEEGKQIKLYTNNKREVLFPSGVKKEIFSDGYQMISFKNGDLKQIFPDQKSIYYYNEAKTIQTTYPDGLQVFKFSNGQIEKHFIDGSKQITFPDGSLRYILNDGYEETYFVDGSVQSINLENVITMKYPDGHKEIKYPDGREESSYGEVKETHQEEELDEIIEDV